MKQTKEFALGAMSNVSVFGEVSGRLILQDNSNEKGLGGIIINSVCYYTECGGFLGG